MYRSVAFALFAAFSVSGTTIQFPGDSLLMDIPGGWNTQKGSAPLVFLARSTTPEPTVPSPDASSFYQNLAVTRQDLSKDLRRVYEKDPVFYLEVVLYTAYANISIFQIQRKTINGISGVYIQASLAANGTIVSNVQFYCLLGSQLYGMAFTGLSSSWQTSSIAFEKSLSTLKRVGK